MLCPIVLKESDSYKPARFSSLLTAVFSLYVLGISGGPTVHTLCTCSVTCMVLVYTVFAHLHTHIHEDTYQR